MVVGKLPAIQLVGPFAVPVVRGAVSIPGELSVLMLANSLVSNLMLLVAWLALALAVVASSECSLSPGVRRIASVSSRLDSATCSFEGQTAESPARTGTVTTG